MNTFHLKIVTPDGVKFDGKAQQLTVRTINGELGILAGHINCAAALGKGRAAVVAGGEKRFAACEGGMLTVLNGNVTLLPTLFHWTDGSVVIT